MTSKPKSARGRPAKAQADDAAFRQMGLFFDTPAPAPVFVPPPVKVAPVVSSAVAVEAPVEAAAPQPEAPLASTMAESAPVTAVASMVVEPASAPAPSEPLSAEALARQLEAHPDYRVLRRLVPTLDWPGTAGGEVLRLLVLDTETTGLEHSRDRIMELAMLRVDVDSATGQPVGPVQVYDGLEDPGQPIPAEVQKITGITPEMVHGQKLDEARIAELLSGVDLIVAHNAGFDRPFVEARLPAFADKDWACSFADLDWKKLGFGSSKLEALALANGWFYDAHRAETDCHALLAVLQAPLPQLDDAQDAAPNALARLLKAAVGLRYRLQATGAPFDAKDALRQRGYRWDAAAKVWHTRLDSAAALDEECAWLKSNVYHGRSAQVAVETLDARTRYANRPGLLATRVL